MGVGPADMRLGMERKRQACCRRFLQDSRSRELPGVPQAQGTFSRTDHILGHKSSLDKFKKIEIMSSIFSDHNTIRLNIN